MTMNAINPFLLLWVISVALLLGLTLFYKWLMKTRFFIAFLQSLFVMLFAVLTAVALEKFAPDPWRHTIMRSEEGVIVLFLFLVFLFPYLLHLYSIWLKNDTDADNPSADKRSFTIENMLIVLGLSITGGLIFGLNPLAVGLLTLSGLSLYPFLKSESFTSENTSAPPVSENSEERKRVLKMVESGTINPSEGSELLAALGSSPSDAGLKSWSKAERLRLLGAALVLLGFFIPWMVISTKDTLGALNTQFEIQTSAQRIPGFSTMSTAQQGFQNLQNLLPNYTVKISAADLKYGLGWIILCMAVSVPAMIWFFEREQRSLHQRIEKVVVYTGAFLLLYITFTSFRHLSLGIFFTLSGYAIMVYTITRKQT